MATAAETGGLTTGGQSVVGQAGDAGKKGIVCVRALIDAEPAQYHKYLR
jgi:hypothetical protein